MIDRNAYADGDATSTLLERRWFAALSASRSLQCECDVLGEVMDQAAAAWRVARARLETIERLRDALGEESAALDGQEQDGWPRVTGLSVAMSAA